MEKRKKERHQHPGHALQFGHREQHYWPQLDQPQKPQQQLHVDRRFLVGWKGFQIEGCGLEYQIQLGLQAAYWR